MRKTTIVLLSIFILKIVSYEQLVLDFPSFKRINSCAAANLEVLTPRAHCPARVLCRVGERPLAEVAEVEEGDHLEDPGYRCILP